jgi:hypothetical protein
VLSRQTLTVTEIAESVVRLLTSGGGSLISRIELANRDSSVAGAE